MNVHPAPATHGSSQILSASPLHVRTPRGAWEYAVTFSADALRVSDYTARGAGFVTHLDIEVVAGRIGIGWTTESGSTFVEERYLEPGRIDVRLPVSPGIVPGLLVLRNADRSDPSEFILHRLNLTDLSPSVYQLAVASRDYLREAEPAGRTEVFEDEAARSINAARLAWLDEMDLPVRGKRVLDVGCGVGHFARFYLERGCTVAGIDGRAENIAELRRRLPAVAGHVGDVQHASLRALGEFDVVHCFGLLYHLDSPVAALRRIAEACGELLVLETMVCDSSRPLVMLADESKSWNQALEGLGCRPSPAFLALALNRVGFPFVYGSTAPPRHPDFMIEFRNDLATTRDGHNLRCVFVAARRPLRHPSLENLLDRSAAS